MGMTSMKMTKEDRAEQKMASPEISAPDYPWGLCVHLDSDAIKKLNMGVMPAVGTELMLKAKVKVTMASESASARPDGDTRTDRSLGMQITDMELEAGEADED